MDTENDKDFQEVAKRLLRSTYPLNKLLYVQYRNEIRLLATKVASIYVNQQILSPSKRIKANKNVLNEQDIYWLRTYSTPEWPVTAFLALGKYYIPQITKLLLSYFYTHDQYCRKYRVT